MEKHNWLVAKIESLTTSWASPEVAAQVGEVDKYLVTFFNPDLVKSYESSTLPPSSQFLMSSLLSAASLTLFYLFSVFFLSFIVKRINPEPAKTLPKDADLVAKFSNEPLLVIAVIYNIAQVVLCAYMVMGAASVAVDKNYTLVCNKFDLKEDSMAKVHWLFYMSKILDMVDTYLIIFRRKWRQLSFLHVYHHASVFILQWINFSAGFDGDVYFIIIANAGVHVVMYAYYLLTTVGVEVPLVLKKMITNMQMLQFVSMLVQGMYLLTNDNCAYPKRLLMLYFSYVVSLLVLFMNFFLVNYNTKNKKQKIQ